MNSSKRLGSSNSHYSNIHQVADLYDVLAGAPRRADSARVFTIVNLCETTIWPAVTPASERFGGGGGFALRPGQSVAFTAC